eukprot:TRINITY_DN22_c0_g1_i2.p1 TRINITY_DN22_c0_g1~~TRINITY_DN22_c0_g1_i2.p1  ORF type:complete len:446 (+),score=71.10 TRINITY_DN22_c0_g1_i2:68-1405(+)
MLYCARFMLCWFFFFFFFSSRRRHTRFLPVSWARRCVQETVKILPQIISLLYSSNAWENLLEKLTFLSKKRGQPKKAMIDMVQLAMTYIPTLTDPQLKVRLVETLKQVCDKKIYLEVEYARCVMMLVQWKESDNDLLQAAKILQDIQVETYGSMDKREKISFILYQMKIMIKIKDYVRLQIISKKINHKAIEDEQLKDLKMQYFAYLFVFYLHEDNYYECAICYKKIYDTIATQQEKPQIEEEKQNSLVLPNQLDFAFNASPKNTFENFVLYAIISKFTPEREQLLREIEQNYRVMLEQNPKLLFAVQQFLLTEIISTNRENYNLVDMEIFSQGIHNSNVHYEHFLKQLIQHNIRVISMYYEEIYLKRMTELFELKADPIETELCEMINEKLVTAKIDRVDQIIRFGEKINENEVLNNWIFDMNKVMDIVDKTCKLIHRDNDQKK